MSTISYGVVQGLGMVGDTLIPNKHSALLVSDSAGEILPGGDVVVQEAQKMLRLLFVVADDVFGVDGIDVCLVLSMIPLISASIHLHKAFCLVTGCTMTTGCAVLSVCRLITACSPFFNSAATPSSLLCTALSPSRRRRKPGESE